MTEQTEKMRRAAAEVRRPQGTGSLLVRRDRHGREHFYGKLRAGSRQVMKVLGPRRLPGESIGDFLGANAI